MASTTENSLSSRLLYKGVHSSIYLQESSGRDAPTLLKVLNAPHPTPQQLVHFNNEYELVKQLDAPGIRPVYDKTTVDGRPALVMAYVPGVPLKQLIQEQRLRLPQQLRIAIKLAQAVQTVHVARIIHKDINGNNVLVGQSGDELTVTLIDFGIASQLNIKLQHLGHPDSLEGTLAYISPEQTGRMNRVVDERTDLYSLGVTLYELFTGCLPFPGDDPMETVHAHLAKLPTPPQELVPELPPVLSEIILKLLAKDADHRYQSAHGLQHDLERCLKQLSPHDGGWTIPAFELAQEDLSGRFRIPQKLYGREEDLCALSNAFQRVTEGDTASSNRAELLLVAGYPGVGKSSMVHELHISIAAKSGYFISGKFDQYQRNVPYLAVRQALDDLTANLLTEPSAQLERWQARLQNAVGEVGQSVLEICPRLELVMGAQPAMEDLPPQERLNRLQMVFQKFIRALAQPEHPLVIFLDDLQWADAGSLALLKTLLIDPQLSNALIICAYRDNEIDAGHPWQLLLDELAAAETAMTTVTVGNLSAEDVTELVTDTFSAEPDAARELGGLLTRQTAGNAFFLTQLLQRLFEDGAVSFDENARQWRWDAAQIQEQGVTANVAELLEQTLTTLPVITQDVLKLAACIGNQFDLKLLATVYERSASETLRDLWGALQEGVLQPLDEQYKTVLSQQDETAGAEAAARFKFLHDRVQQGAYGLIDEAERTGTHLKIGRAMLAHTPEEQLSERVFALAAQFNQAHSLLEDAERQIVISLNERAGRQAAAGGAFAAAANFYRQGAALFADDVWATEYDLALRLHTAWAEACYAAHQHEIAEKLFTLVLKQARDVLDKAPIYEMQITAYSLQMKLQEGLESGLQALAELGEPLPTDLAPEEIQAMMFATAKALAEKSQDDLLGLPRMTDPAALATFKILNGVSMCAMFLKSPAIVPITCRMLDLSLRTGNTPFTCYAYGLYGVTLAMGGDVAGMTQWYRFGYRLAEHLHDRRQIGLGLHMNYGSMCQHTMHLRQAIPLHARSFPLLQETGEIRWLGYAYTLYHNKFLYAGYPLSDVRQLLDDYTPTMLGLHQPQQTLWLALHKQLVANLTGEAPDPATFTGDYVDTEQEIRNLQAAQDLLMVGVIQCYQTFLDILFGTPSENLLESMTQIEALLPAAGGKFVQIYGTAFLWHAALLLLSAYPDDAETQKAYQEKIDSLTADIELLNSLCPANFLHKAQLLRAEQARVEGRIAEALPLYDLALTNARQQEFLHEEALIAETAARCYRQLGVERSARLYLQDADSAYQRWGAFAKTAQLEERYPWLGEAVQAAPEQAGAGKVGTTMTTGTASTFLDTDTLLKASQTLSQEVQLDRVLYRLMTLVLENAGAQRGVLLLKEGEQLLVQARGGTDEKIRVLDGTPLESADAELSTAIVEYTARTQDSVVLADAAQDRRFTRDSYIFDRRPRSVLCLPIEHQGSLTGVLYLENNLHINAFTPDRQELLNVLCSQAAISLENARLVEGMRTQERLQKEMELAQRIQTALLPQLEEAQHPDFEIAAIMQPADEVGGDYYDVLTARDGSLWLAVGDVSGHGVTPGLVMMMAQTIHATLVKYHDYTPQQVINLLNNMLFGNVNERLNAEHFMTFTTLKYRGDGCFEYAGSHLTIIVHRVATNVCERFDTTGCFLNLIPNIEHATEQSSLTLEIGDTLVLYTDGLTEAHKPGGDILDIQRFFEFVQRHAAKPPEVMRDAILDDVLAWSEQYREDDMTLVIVRRVA